MGRHLESRGTARVLLTAPAKGTIKNIVSGVNSSVMNQNDVLLGAASCTTNAIVPVLKAVNTGFEIVHGHMETVHAYTNDQNLIDNYHKKNRRGRGAPLNMVITETGASSAVTKLLPELEGKLTGNAIRVPTPNVSLAILNLTLANSVSVAEVNDFLRNASLHSGLQRQIDYTEAADVVSSDFVGNRHACIVDGGATLAKDNRVVLYVWYDNEFGYACQVIRVVQKWAGISYPLIPTGCGRAGVLRHPSDAPNCRRARNIESRDESGCEVRAFGTFKGRHRSGVARAEAPLRQVATPRNLLRGRVSTTRRITGAQGTLNPGMRAGVRCGVATGRAQPEPKHRFGRWRRPATCCGAGCQPPAELLARKEH